jgi:hypothetical protein
LSGAKGDVRAKYRLIEAKRTDKGENEFFKANMIKWLEKIRGEAIKDNRMPALAVEVGKKRYIIIEECYFG